MKGSQSLKIWLLKGAILLVLAGFVFAILFPAFAKAHVGGGPYSSKMGHAQFLAKQCAEYANEHNGKFPDFKSSPEVLALLLPKFDDFEREEYKRMRFVWNQRLSNTSVVALEDPENVLLVHSTPIGETLIAVTADGVPHKMNRKELNEMRARPLRLKKSLRPFNQTQLAKTFFIH